MIKKESSSTQDIHTLVMNCPRCGCYMVYTICKARLYKHIISFKVLKSNTDQNLDDLKYAEDKLEQKCKKCGFKLKRDISRNNYYVNQCENTFLY